jgi:hypothetical protein
LVRVHPVKSPLSNPVLVINCVDEGETVIPAPVPLKVTAVAVVQFLPEIVTTVPGGPLEGVKDVIVGNPITVKPMNADEVPFGVVTVTVRNPTAAPGPTEIVTGTVVEVPPVPTVAVTPDPLKVTAVAAVRLVPVMVALNVVPGVDEPGDTVLILAGATTVNPLNAVDVPTGVVTVTVRTPTVATLVIVMVIGRVVAVPPLPTTAVTPDPLNATADAPVRSVPVIVALTVAP